MEKRNPESVNKKQEVLAMIDMAKELITALPDDHNNIACLFLLATGPAPSEPEDNSWVGKAYGLGDMEDFVQFRSVLDEKIAEMILS
jgi:hypothetical protein